MIDIYHSKNGCFYMHGVTERPQIADFHVHLHNEYEIIYILQGDCSYVIEDRTYKLKKHDLIITAPAKYHHIKIDSSTPYDRCIMSFDPLSFPVGHILSHEQSDVINCENNSLIQNLFKRLDYYFVELSETAFEDAFYCLLKELLYNINIFQSKLHFIDTHYSTNSTMAKVLGYIEENLCSIRQVQEIARANYVSDVYLFRLFKSSLKISPHKYITDKRLTLAQKMIRSGTRPTVAFERCGFLNYTTFFKSYSKHFGHAPSEDYAEG